MLSISGPDLKLVVVVIDCYPVASRRDAAMRWQCNAIGDGTLTGPSVFVIKVVHL
jgi:hypothetical protein